jgi:hypothetical protein
VGVEVKDARACGIMPVSVEVHSVPGEPPKYIDAKPDQHKSNPELERESETPLERYAERHGQCANQDQGQGVT